MPFDKAASKEYMRWPLQENKFTVYDHVTQGGTSSRFILKLDGWRVWVYLLL